MVLKRFGQHGRFRPYDLSGAGAQMLLLAVRPAALS
jgi:hypothetical protein